jgi:hypothetical protein
MAMKPSALKEGVGISRTLTSDAIEVPELKGKANGDPVVFAIVGTIKSIENVNGRNPTYNISVSNIIAPPSRPQANVAPSAPAGGQPAPQAQAKPATPPTQAAPAAPPQGGMGQ